MASLRAQAVACLFCTWHSVLAARAGRELLGLHRYQQPATTQEPEELIPPSGPVPPNLARFVLPPPPPELAPLAYGQPADVALGDLVVAGLVDRPTRTPPPTQSSVDVAAGCPILEAWPSSVEVSAPDPCQSRVGGHWFTPGGMLGGGEPLMTWELKCWLQAPKVAYEVPSGDLFGFSQTAGVLTDETVTLYDCRGNPMYSLQERVYHATGHADPRVCERYGSCDGTVWLQYVLYNYADGEEVARTAYLHLFQSSFTIQDKKGKEIAKISRAGDWDPTSSDCQVRKWILDFASREPEDPFFSPAEQWPFAELVTIISVRDTSRRSSGLLAPSSCDVKGYLPQLLLGFILLAAACVLIVIFVNKGRDPMQKFMLRLEDRVCPRRMRVPAKFEFG